jgi:putative endonuclease
MHQYLSYYTYILFSKKLNKYYVGSTSNLENRITEHNSGEGKYTKLGIPWSIIKCYEHKTRSEAMKLENKIKKRGIKRFFETNI